ncbi:MAG: putative histidine kinase, atypical unorthodox [Ramlibacter sp.]|nr:putative histidine kinase, atypical unorthodox [Ramlibacter sp.]
MMRWTSSTPQRAGRWRCDRAPHGRRRPPPLFDRASALETLGGDEELLEHVLPVFRSNLQTAAQQLEHPLRLPQAEAKRLMHTIKGMAANLGALALAAAAAEAESRLATGDLNVESPVAEVAREIQAVLFAIDGWER